MDIYINGAFLSILVIGIIEGAFAICQPLSQDIQNKSISTGDRATLLSAYAMAGDVFAAITNITVGKASDISLEAGLLLCGLLSAVAVVLIFVYYKQRSIVKESLI